MSRAAALTRIKGWGLAMLASHTLQLRVAAILPAAPLILEHPLLGGSQTVASATRHKREEKDDAKSIRSAL